MHQHQWKSRVQSIFLVTCTRSNSTAAWRKMYLNPSPRDATAHFSFTKQVTPASGKEVQKKGRLSLIDFMTDNFTSKKKISPRRFTFWTLVQQLAHTSQWPAFIQVSIQKSLSTSISVIKIRFSSPWRCDGLASMQYCYCIFSITAGPPVSCTYTMDIRRVNFHAK